MGRTIVTLHTPYILHIMERPLNEVILLGTHPAHPVYWFDFTFRYISDGFTFQMIFRYSLNDIFPFQMVSFEIRWFYSHIWFQMIFRFRWFSDGKRHAPVNQLIMYHSKVPTKHSLFRETSDSFSFVWILPLDDRDVL